MPSNLDRRTFLAGAAAGAAVSRSYARSLNLPDDQRPSTAIRLGVASYLFRKFGQADVIKFCTC